VGKKRDNTKTGKKKKQRNRMACQDRRKGKTSARPSLVNTSIERSGLSLGKPMWNASILDLKKRTKNWRREGEKKGGTGLELYLLASGRQRVSRQDGAILANKNVNHQSL